MNNEELEKRGKMMLNYEDINHESNKKQLFTRIDLMNEFINGAKWQAKKEAFRNYTNLVVETFGDKK